MAVILRKEGTVILQITIPQRVRVMLKTDAVEIPIPGQREPWLMQIGGVSKHIVIEWREVAGNLHSNISKLMNDILSGEMLVKYTVTIEEWGITKDCVVFDLEFGQQESETNTLTCRMTLAMGEII